MNFDSPRLLDAMTYDMLLSEWTRGQNRARIANQANGVPPYTDAEVEENGINVNVNDLTHTRLMHDARTQFENAFGKAQFYARAATDAGVSHRRVERSSIVTREWNRRMKQSNPFFEARRAKFGTLVLHGIGPGAWENEDRWCPRPLGVEDVLMPGETLLGFENLPFFAIRRSFTGPELARLTRSDKRDPGWNMPFVQRIMQWMDQQATMLRSLNWPDVWAPEKIAERNKEEAGGFLAGDRAPRIDVFDIYGYVDDDNNEGWVRRIILDSWSEPGIPQPKPQDWKRKTGVTGETNAFLFSSGNRRVAQSWQSIASFQFADLSAVFPARYHSVRSLGWMLYAACHLGNRLRCKFYESVLEALMMLYEVENQQDAQNALKLNLINKGFIDRTIKPVKAQDRWQVNAGLVELGLRDNQQVINANAAAWVQNQDFSSDRTEKTRFQVMAELQAATSLFSSALLQASAYQVFEFREIFRRFCKPNSSDPDVRAFRAACLRQGVPEKILSNPDCWEIQSERIMGAGNKTLEMTIAEQLMAWRTQFDPGPQRMILRDAVLAITDDAAKANNLVPDEAEKVTPGIREASHIAGDLMQGIPVEPMDGENQIEIIETLLKIMGQKVTAAQRNGNMVAPDQLMGLQAIAQQINTRIQILSQDKEQQARVKVYGNLLTNLTNELKGFAQRLQQQMKARMAQGGGGMDPKDAAKIAAINATAQAKIQNMRESHAQRTAQRNIQFQQDVQQRMVEHQADLSAKDIEAASNVRRNRLTSLSE